MIHTLMLCMLPGIPWHVNDPVIQQMHISATKWRRYYQVAPQTLDERCCILAQRHAEYMAKYEWYEHGRHDQVIHRGPTSAAACISGWVYSPPHFGWLLSNTRKCGWGHAVSRNGIHYWVGVFK